MAILFSAKTVEIKIAAIYAGFGVKGFYPYMNGFLGDFETKPATADAYDKINKKNCWKNNQPRCMV